MTAGTLLNTFEAKLRVRLAERQIQLESCYRPSLQLELFGNLRVKLPDPPGFFTIDRHPGRTPRMQERLSVRLERRSRHQSLDDALDLEKAGAPFGRVPAGGLYGAREYRRDFRGFLHAHKTGCVFRVRYHAR